MTSLKVSRFQPIILQAAGFVAAGEDVRSPRQNETAFTAAADTGSRHWILI
jgi:hypothetical protein